MKRIRRARGRAAAAAVLAAVAVLGVLFLLVIGIDALEGRSEFQFYADSSTYHELARGDLFDIEGLGDLVGIAGNFLGPLAMLRLTGSNYYAVLALNTVLMMLAVLWISRRMELNAFHFVLILLANPLTISSLLAVNKEILSVAFTAVLIAWIRSRSLLLLPLAAILALLVRWQLAVALVFIVLMIAVVPPIGRRRAIAIGALLMALSALYVAMLPVFEPISASFELSAAEYEGSGFYEWLIAQQQAGLYWAVFPLKAAHLLFGLGLRIDRLLAPASIYNDVWQLLHSTALLVLFIMLWRSKRLTLNDNLVFASAIYVAIFALSPIYSPRYFYPVYLLWAATLLSPRATSISLRSIRRPRRASHPVPLDTSQPNPVVK